MKNNSKTELIAQTTVKALARTPNRRSAALALDAHTAVMMAMVNSSSTPMMPKMAIGDASESSIHTNAAQSAQLGTTPSSQNTFQSGVRPTIANARQVAITLP